MPRAIKPADSKYQNMSKVRKNEDFMRKQMEDSRKAFSAISKRYNIGQKHLKQKKHDQAVDILLKLFTDDEETSTQIDKLKAEYNRDVHQANYERAPASGNAINARPKVDVEPTRGSAATVTPMQPEVPRWDSTRTLWQAAKAANRGGNRKKKGTPVNIEEKEEEPDEPKRVARAHEAFVLGIRQVKWSKRNEPYVPRGPVQREKYEARLKRIDRWLEFRA